MRVDYGEGEISQHITKGEEEGVSSCRGGGIPIFVCGVYEGVIKGVYEGVYVWYMCKGGYGG
jgi:hypothetical protein